MKKGDKYIIEIAEVHTHYDDNGKPYPVARIKGFSVLTFDQRGLDKLEKCESKNIRESFLNCKFVVVDDGGSGSFTKGKIYEAIGGKILNDFDGMFPLVNYLHSFDELESYLGNGSSPIGYYNSSTPMKILKVVE